MPKLTHVAWRDETEVLKSFLSTSTAFGSSLHLAGLPSGIRTGANSLWMAYANTNVLVPAAILDCNDDSLKPSLKRTGVISTPLGEKENETS